MRRTGIFCVEEETDKGEKPNLPRLRRALDELTTNAIADGRPYSVLALPTVQHTEGPKVSTRLFALVALTDPAQAQIREYCEFEEQLNPRINNRLLEVFPENAPGERSREVWHFQTMAFPHNVTEEGMPPLVLWQRIAEQHWTGGMTEAEQTLIALGPRLEWQHHEDEDGMHETWLHVGVRFFYYIERVPVYCPQHDLKDAYLMTCFLQTTRHNSGPIGEWEFGTLEAAKGACEWHYATGSWK